MKDHMATKWPTTEEKHGSGFDEEEGR